MGAYFKCQPDRNCDCGECDSCRTPLLDRIDKGQLELELVQQSLDRGTGIPAGIDLICLECGPDQECVCFSEQVLRQITQGDQGERAQPGWCVGCGAPVATRDPENRFQIHHSDYLCSDCLEANRRALLADQASESGLLPFEE